MLIKVIFWLAAALIVAFFAFFTTKLVQKNHEKYFDTEFKFPLALIDTSGAFFSILALSFIRLTDPTYTDICFWGVVLIISYIIGFRVNKWGKMT